jgi:hypothetical protein
MPELRNQGELALTKHSEDGPVSCHPLPMLCIPAAFYPLEGISDFISRLGCLPTLSDLAVFSSCTQASRRSPETAQRRLD